jgi:hypothetical protein
MVGGEVSPGSGSGWRRPNDVRDPVNLWEMKRTASKAITVKLSDLETLRRRAITSGRDPLMHLEFGAGSQARRYVVIPEDDYMALRDAHPQDQT